MIFKKLYNILGDLVSLWLYYYKKLFMVFELCLPQKPLFHYFYSRVTFLYFTGANTLIGAKPLSTDFPFYQSLFLQSTILHLSTRLTADFVSVIIASKRWSYDDVQYRIKVLCGCGQEKCHASRISTTFTLFSSVSQPSSQCLL